MSLVELSDLLQPELFAPWACFIVVILTSLFKHHPGDTLDFSVVLSVSHLPLSWFILMFYVISPPVVSLERLYGK